MRRLALVLFAAAAGCGESQLTIAELRDQLVAAKVHLEVEEEELVSRRAESTVRQTRLFGQAIKELCGYSPADASEAFERYDLAEQYSTRKSAQEKEAIWREISGAVDEARAKLKRDAETPESQEFWRKWDADKSQRLVDEQFKRVANAEVAVDKLRDQINKRLAEP